MISILVPSKTNLIYRLLEHTASLDIEEDYEIIVCTRDYAFHTYFESPRFLNMINNKFGHKAIDNIKRMTSIKLKRKLLEGVEYGRNK